MLISILKYCKNYCENIVKFIAKNIRHELEIVKIQTNIITKYCFDRDDLFTYDINVNNAF